MYLNVNIILIILAYQCLTICCIEDDESFEETTTLKQSGFSIKFHPPNKTDVIQKIVPKESGFSIKFHPPKKPDVIQKIVPKESGFSIKFHPPNKTDVSHEESMTAGKSSGHQHKKRFERFQEDDRPEPKGTVHEDCKFYVPYEDYNMPVPITNSTKPKVLHPDKNRFIHVKQFDYFRAVCAGTKFQYPLNFNQSELVLRCLGRDLFEHEGKTFTFNRLKCVEIPKPTSILTKKKCLNKYSVVKIGFNLQDDFVHTYQVCFDMWTKNPLFSWYSVKTPHHDMRQISVMRPEFIRSQLFGEVDLDGFYNKQMATVEKTLKSRLVARRYIRKGDGEHFLTKGHLISNIDFNYVFEQDATFFYENSCPQWRLFIDGIWSDLEKLFRRNLAKASNGTHVVVAGTYGVCTLPDAYRAQQPILLFPPKGLLVPLFMWKMDYNVETQTGIVFLAMNDLYKPTSNSLYICDVVPCPGKLIRRFKTRSVHYCCTKEGFEKAFGRFDAHLFKVDS